MIFRQLFDNTSSTYTYLLADENHRQAMLIDPVFGQVRRDLALIRELGLTLTLHGCSNRKQGAGLHRPK
mgnify:CR=1 FL=1